MIIVRTVPLLASLFLLAGLVGCKKEVETVFVNTANIPDTTGQVLYLPFTGNAIDSSNYKNTAQVFGVTPTTDRFNRGDRAYYFNGTNAYITLPYSNALDLKVSFSLCCWIKPDGYPNDIRGIIWHGDAASGKDPYVLYYKNTGSGVTLSARKDVLDGLTYNELFLPNNTFFSGTWNHVVATYNGTTHTFRFYINGELLSTTNYTTSQLNYPTNNFWTTIGGIEINNALFKGKLDDVRIFNREISAAEVKTIFQY